MSMTSAISSGKPACYAKGPDKRVPMCRSCAHKKGCENAAAKYAEIQSVAQHAHDQSKIVLEDADDWTVEQGIKCCERMHRKHVGVGRPYFRSPNFHSAINRALGMCSSECIDPELYFEAQFVILALFSKSRRGAFYPNMLNGKNAVDRYERFVDGNKRRTHNIKARHSPEVEDEILAGECFYAELVIRNILTDAGLSEDEIRQEVEQLYDKWDFNNPTRRSIAPRALQHVLDTVHPGLSLRAYIKGPFTWKQVADFITQVCNVQRFFDVSDELDGQLM